MEFYTKVLKGEAMKLPKTRYSPWDLLPVPEPRTVNPPFGEFYEKVAKPLIQDVVRIMDNGIPISLKKVRELDNHLAKVLDDVDKRIQTNPLIKQFQILEHAHLKKQFIAEKRSKMRSFRHYIKEFDASNLVHRSYFMEEIRKIRPEITPPEDMLPTGIPKWTKNYTRHFIDKHPAVRLLLNNRITFTNSIAKAAMLELAKDKANIYNETYKQAIENADSVQVPPFNPGSSQQKQRFFSWLGEESDSVSKTTGLPSWDRDQIERINRETTNPDLKDLTQAFIDYSFGATVKDNFINNFYKYTINDRLYGNLKLFGAKSFRLTSSNPNLLNMPSTRSIYSKPVKECLVAPEGFVIYAIDYSALEDRVMASLSRDKNKCAVFTEGLDGHCLNAYGYFKDEIAKYMEITGDTNTDVKKFFELCENGHKELKAIRQKGKPATFGLSYGSYPPKVAKTLKIPLEQAEEIFNSYHNELYRGITQYREGYVLPTAKENGKLHLGMGCYIKTDNADRDIRTLNNATCQFWSILTLLTINKLHALIDQENLSEDIKCISTIYDSIYFQVKADPAVVKWLNDRVVPIMSKDYIENQTIANEATGEIGLDWAYMDQVPHNSSLTTIKEILGKLPIKAEIRRAISKEKPDKDTLEVFNKTYFEEYVQFCYDNSVQDIFDRTLRVLKRVKKLVKEQKTQAKL